MKKTAVVLFLLVLILIIIAYLLVSIPNSTTDYEISGQWECSNAVPHDFTTDESSESILVPIKLDIDSDGNVSGTVGDAVLENGKLKVNRNLIGRYFNVKSDYVIVDAEIIGAIANQDTKEIREVNIYLNYQDETLIGSVNLKEFLKYPDPVFSSLTLTKTENN